MTKRRRSWIEELCEAPLLMYGEAAGPPIKNPPNGPIKVFTVEVGLIELSLFFHLLGQDGASKTDSFGPPHLVALLPIRRDLSLQPALWT